MRPGNVHWPKGTTVSWRQALFAIAVSLLLGTVLSPVSVARAATDDGSVRDAGEAIYREGILGSGKPLVGSRYEGMRTTGKAAACVNCHRRSGLGGKEGRSVIPPISARYLYFNPFAPTSGDLTLPFADGMRTQRGPYTDATVARAIREGIDADGKPLDYLMPRFDLDDKDMAALIGYLKRLDDRNTRGVTPTVLNFATIITPDADPVARQGMLDVLQRFFDDKNLAPIGPTPQMHTSHKFRFMVNPHWQLHVWQLRGPADTWQAQLKDDLAREPVFAVISGLGGRNWQPIHAFCEKEALPCLFPNVEVPPADADRDFYSLYFSRGVLLEADLMAQNLLANPGHASVRRVQQVYRAGDSGEPAAKALAAELRRHGIDVIDRAVAADAPRKVLRRMVSEGAHADALVLWLRPHDIESLGPAPASHVPIFLSGLMGGLENAPLPPAWRAHAHLAYPFELPDQRRISVDFAFGWFRIRQIPLVAPRVQADTYLACSLLADSLRRMVDAFDENYLIERIEDMLDGRIITGYYPHLSLAPDQRFASKGGYLVHFDKDKGAQVSADESWIVPQTETGDASMKTATE